MKKRPVFQTLKSRLSEPRRFIQFLLGPRQVGKTTLALQLAESLERPTHYASADLAALQSLAWLEQQWELGREQVNAHRGALLILDEVQKIPHWSDMVKHLWDCDTRLRINLSVVILGSSPWLMQRGLTESLAGRFEILPITHWSFAEMEQHFGWTLDHYLFFGGYPGAAPLADPEDSSRWATFINDTLIETTVSRDVLLLTQVNKPALLRRLFQLSCSYSGQVLSYQKMIGQLQEAGNTTTLAHYLDLLNGAWLVGGLQKVIRRVLQTRPTRGGPQSDAPPSSAIATAMPSSLGTPYRRPAHRQPTAVRPDHLLQKYARQPMRRKGSSPKLAVYNSALMTAQLGLTYREARKKPTLWGHLVESAAGAHLLNGIRGTQIELSYWREGDKEVDFVLQQGDRLIAIEVKSNHERLSSSGMDSFVKQFAPDRVLLVGEEGIPLETFLKTAPKALF